MFNRIKKYYDKGIYSAENVAQFVIKGIITAEQYEQIVGEPYPQE